MLRGPQEVQRYALDLHEGYLGVRDIIPPFGCVVTEGMTSFTMFKDHIMSDDITQDPCSSGPYMLFKRVTQKFWSNVRLFDIDQDMREKIINVILNGKAPPSSTLDHFSKLFESRFQMNYTDVLIPPLCVKAMVGYIPSMLLSASFTQSEIDERVFATNSLLNEIARNYNVFYGIWNHDREHFVAYMVVFPILPDQAGFVLIMDPYGNSSYSADDSECVKEIHQLVKYMASVKEARKQLPGGVMPVFHTVHVCHPLEFTQDAKKDGAEVYPSDCACNFWCTILLFIWINFYERLCEKSDIKLNSALTDMFVTDSGKEHNYNFNVVNPIFGCMRRPEYTMASVRIYTALFLQQFFQFEDLKEANELMRQTPRGSFGFTVDAFTFAKTKTTLIEGMATKYKQPYVMAGSPESYDHYLTLCSLCEACTEPMLKKKFLDDLPLLDLYRLLCGVFFDRRIKGNSDSAEFYKNFMKRILVYDLNDHEPGDNAQIYMESPTLIEWTACPFRTYKSRVLLPENVPFIVQGTKTRKRDAPGTVLVLDEEESDSGPQSKTART